MIVGTRVKRNKMDREVAESHWKYTEGIIRLVFEFMLKLTHYLYVEAMIHSVKHREQKDGQ